MDLAALIRHARGDAPADLLLKDARLVNVLSGEVLPAGVATYDSRVAGVDDTSMMTAARLAPVSLWVDQQPAAITNRGDETCQPPSIPRS